LEEVAGLVTVEIDGGRDGKDGVYCRARDASLDLLKIGLVFQNFNLFPHFSVLRNITEAQVQVLGRCKATLNERALRLSRRWGWSQSRVRYPCDIVRRAAAAVSIARALRSIPRFFSSIERQARSIPSITGEEEILKVIRELASE
jgi:polar amino acid transport system ATP-binding protein